MPITIGRNTITLRLEDLEVLVASLDASSSPRIQKLVRFFRKGIPAPVITAPQITEPTLETEN
jgi:hypothetical protein